MFRRKDSSISRHRAHRSTCGFLHRPRLHRSFRTSAHARRTAPLITGNRPCCAGTCCPTHHPSSPSCILCNSANSSLFRALGASIERSFEALQGLVYGRPRNLHWNRRHHHLVACSAAFLGSWYALLLHHPRNSVSLLLWRVLTTRNWSSWPCRAQLYLCHCLLRAVTGILGLQTGQYDCRGACFASSLSSCCLAALFDPIWSQDTPWTIVLRSLPPPVIWGLPLLCFGRAQPLFPPAPQLGLTRACCTFETTFYSLSKQL